jgi:hypothetical protein
MTFEPDDLEAAEIVIFVSLACVMKRCPDKEVKEYAKDQLNDPFWDHQKSIGIWFEH